jgi:hypothetical protein
MGIVPSLLLPPYLNVPKSNRGGEVVVYIPAYCKISYTIFLISDIAF